MDLDLNDQRSKKRASQSFRSLPFNSSFYASAQLKGLDAEMVFLNSLEFCKDGVTWFRNADDVETSFRWLIKVGVMRREVDGQGLTSRIRLTPLGRKIREQGIDLPVQKANSWERIIFWFERNWPLL